MMIFTIFLELQYHNPFLLPAQKPEKGSYDLIRRPEFDSQPTECGPPAMMADKGIVSFYNGKNFENEDAATELPIGMHSVGKVVFAVNDPGKGISRSDTCM
jgi:hypothetical protein